MSQSPRSPAGNALTELVLEVFRVNGRLLAAGDRMARPAGQTSARWQVLGAVDREPRTVSQIARMMGLTRQSVQRTADRLHAEGLVAHTDNPAHRRAKLVTLTARGRRVLDAITQQQIAWANRLGARIGAAELGQALRVLQAFREDLERGDRHPLAGRRSVHRDGVARPQTRSRGSAR